MLAMPQLAPIVAEPAADTEPPGNPWRPSEYTGLMIQALESAGSRLVHGSVLELGTGSGILLATLARLGADRLTGTDIEPSALVEAASLLGRLGHAAELLLGDLWAPVEGRRFDLIIANPPTFPARVPHYPGRLPSWSDGGPDGWRFFAPFLEGLATHLAPGGRAVVQHSGLLGLDATARLLARHGLAMRCLASSLMPVAPEKHAVLNPDVLARAEPRGVRLIGDHLLLAADILEIGTADSLGGA